MILFSAIAGLMALLGVLFVSLPLLRRAIQGGGGRALGDTVPAAITVVSVPLIAVAIYLVNGNPQAIDPPPPVDIAADVTVDPSPQQLAGLAVKLTAKLAQYPGDARAWHMLASVYGASGQTARAVHAYEKAAALTPADPQLLVDYAEQLAVAHGRRLHGKPMTLLQAALRIDPQHQRALALAGNAAFEDGDYLAAASYWQRLVGTLTPDSEMAHSVSGRIDEARARVTTTVSRPAATRGGN